MQKTFPPRMTAPLYIESETKVVSPQCLLDQGDQDEDRKRTKVGIGEVVTLALNGKRVRDVDPDSLEWSLEPEKAASIEKSNDDINQATLTISRNLTEDTNLKVRVKPALMKNCRKENPPFSAFSFPLTLKRNIPGNGWKNIPGTRRKTDRELPPSLS